MRFAVTYTYRASASGATIKRLNMKITPGKDF